MKLRKNERYWKWGVTAFSVIVAAAFFWLIFSNLSGFFDIIAQAIKICAPIIYGGLFAYLMNPILRFVQSHTSKLLDSRTKWKKKTIVSVSKNAGLICSTLTMVALLVALVALIVPSVVESLEDLLQPQRLERYYSTIEAWATDLVSGTVFEEWVNNHVDNLLMYVLEILRNVDIGSFVSNFTSSIYSVIIAVVDVLIGLVAAVYMLIYKTSLKSQSKKLVVAIFNHDHADKIFEVARLTDRMFSGFVIGKLLDALIIGCITYLFVLIVPHMPYALLIGVIVGVTNVIPFFGPFIGAVPCILLLLLDNPMNALIFTIFIVILQQIDGNIIGNRILGETVGISDFWVLVSILIFGGVFGVTGMLLGVPVFAVIYTLIAESVNKRLKKKSYPVESTLYHSIQSVHELPVTPPTYGNSVMDRSYELQIDENDDEPDD